MILPTAFEQARKLISRREMDEQVEVESAPMIASGMAMEGKWRSFIKEMERRSGDGAVQKMPPCLATPFVIARQPTWAESRAVVGGIEKKMTA